MVDTILSRGSLLIYLTLLLGLILQVFPLPDWAAQLRPQWPLLLLIYWSMLFPDRIGIFTAMLVGLFVDVMLDALLGQHVLAYAVAIFIVITTYKRLRLMHAWQQALAVFLLLMIERIIAAVVLGMTRGQATDLSFWLPPLTGMLTWPLLGLLFSDFHRRARLG
ncbi:MAG: rod shape-determining protein MreD [Sedimenticolaceae bacterium]|nr:rod shape-determining protein MreD [Sedimenticolaceae bacterium]